MVECKRFIFAVIIGLSITATVYADMMPATRPDVGYRRSSCACSDFQHTNSSIPYVNCPGVAGLVSQSFNPLPDSKTDVGQTYKTQSLQILTDGQSSFSLCAYALIGLGLCSSVHWVKNLHIAFIPEWYHCGGPLQIGHSHAIGPDALCSSQAVCFIQPDCTASDISANYSIGTITFLLRKSLFTPNVLVCRGPPFRSC